MFSALNEGEDVLPGNSMRNPVSVGDYSFVREKGRKSNRVFYYVVKIVEIKDDNIICEWYELDMKKDLFRQKTAKWGVKYKSLLCTVDPPHIFGEGRRQKVIFPKVYKFLSGKEFSEDHSQ